MISARPATLAAGGGQNVVNAGQINVLGGNVNVTTGNVINTAAQGGTISVTGGNMAVTGDLTHSSTAATGVNVAAGRTLSAANISNSAGAAIVNAGTLSATNPIANAGTLNTTGTVNGGIANTGTVNAAGQVNAAVANNAGSFTVTGALTGDNSFTNSGTATLNVSGGDYSGITTLTSNSTSAAAVTVAAARTLSATAAINNTAGTFTNNGTLAAPAVANSGTGTLDNNATVTGAVNNAATFNNNAGGTVSGLLTNTAGITTNTGQLNGGANIGGGTLQIGAGGTSGTIAGDIANNGTLAFNRSDAITVANNISGTGGVNHNGMGVTTLTGASNYSGTTNVNAGTLRVNGSITGPVIVGANGTLGGTGSMGGVTFAGGGTFDPGASIGTTTINGPLTLSAASTTRIEFSPTASDRIVVNGPATLAGSVRAIAQAGTFANTLSHTFLTSTGRSGTFSGVTLDSSINPQLLQLVLSYTATDAILNVTPLLASALPAGTSSNAQAVANGISSGVVAFGGFGRLTNLLNLPTAQLPALLTALSGEIFTAVQEPSLRLGSQFGGSLLDQLGARRAALQRSAIAAERSPLIALASADPVHLAQLGKGIRGGVSQPQWNVWGSGHGGQGNVDGDAVTGSSKLKYSAGGAAAGVDFLLSPNLILGVAGSHGKAHFNLDAQPSSGRSDLTQLGFYASYRAGAVDLDGMIAYGAGSQRTTRTVAAPVPRSYYAAKAI